MSIHVQEIRPLQSRKPFTAGFQFEITFDCIAPGIQGDLEWKIIYVGSADDEKCDQEIVSADVGPITVGRSRFTLESDPIDSSKIPACELLGVTILLVTCSYQSHEFLRVGYYVNNEYSEPREENDPSPVDVNKVVQVISDKPRVTRFQINWDGPNDEDKENFQRENDRMLADGFDETTNLVDLNNLPEEDEDETDDEDADVDMS